ncbi:hypothetical protein [Micromonospora sp. NPDC051296]|uniref:hypothetical protein n=1 Tax=Micromonospora sp. NPDC051296 TaxID=3155046 RepID=UPI00342F6DF5
MTGRRALVTGWGGKRLARLLCVLLAVLLALIAVKPGLASATGRHGASAAQTTADDGYQQPDTGSTVVRDDDRECPGEPFSPGKQACRGQSFTVAPTTVTMLPSLTQLRWRPVPPRPERRDRHPLLEHLRPRLTQLAVSRT